MYSKAKAMRTIDASPAKEYGWTALEVDPKLGEGTSKSSGFQNTKDLQEKMKSLSDKKKKYMESASTLDHYSQPKQHMTIDVNEERSEGIQLYKKRRHTTKRATAKEELAPQKTEEDSVSNSQSTNQFKSIFKVSHKKDN